MKKLSNATSLINLERMRRACVVGGWIVQIHDSEQRDVVRTAIREIFDLILSDGKKTFKKVLLHPSLNSMVTSGLLRGDL